jgi:hypothetical protein
MIEPRPHSREFFALIATDFGEGKRHFLQRVDHRCDDHEASEPLVIRRHDVPRRVLGAGMPNGLFVGCLLHI